MNGLNPAQSSVISDVSYFKGGDLGRYDHVFNIYADGCPGLLYHECKGGVYRNEDEKVAPLIVYGQTVAPIRLSARGEFLIIIIKLRPYVLGSLFGLRAGEVTDSCVPVDELSLPGFNNAIEILHLLPLINDKIQILKQLVENSASGIPIDRQIQHAVELIHQTRGAVAIRELYNTLYMTEKTFERRFDHVVGINPKTFSNICRFNESIDKIRSGKYANLSDVAFDLGFSDQSHFIRSFKKFAGESPGKLTSMTTLR